MIESCSKKRMLLAISFLGGLTVLVLIIESHWTDTADERFFTESYETNSNCSSKEDYEIISECHPCTAFELASQSISVCSKAKYKEIIECKSGEQITRSCDRVVWLEENAFWKFITFNFAAALLSVIAVFWRERILRQRIIRKVARQLRNSA